MSKDRAFFTVSITVLILTALIGCGDGLNETLPEDGDEPEYQEEVDAGSGTSQEVINDGGITDEVVDDGGGNTDEVVDDGGGGATEEVVDDGDTLLAGGGGSDDGGISGTGIISTGAIDAFGSIFVNGVRFTTADADVTVDGVDLASNALAEGMYVQVVGTVDGQGSVGTASKVTYITYFRGPNSELVYHTGNDYRTIISLGQKIVVHATDTKLVGIDYANLAGAEWIEVSGVLLQDQVLLATRLEATSLNQLEPLKLTSTITATDGTTATLENDLTFSVADVTLANEGSGSIAVGQIVEVSGSLSGDVLLSPTVSFKTSYSPFDPVTPAAGEPFNLEGDIVDLQSATQFDVAGISVDASTATLLPNFIPLSEGLVVRVEGEFNSSQLVATTVYVQTLIEEGTLTQISSADGILQARLEAYGETLVFSSNNDTQFIDETGGIEALTFDDLQLNDRVLLNLEYSTSDELMVTRLSRIGQFSGVSSDSPSKDILTHDDVTQSLESGILTVSFDSTLAPAPGQIFTVTVPNGTQLDDIQLPELDDGLAWDLSELYSAEQLRVIEVPWGEGISPHWWLSASDEGALNKDEVGGQVNRWYDKSGNDYHARASYAGRPSCETKRPIWDGATTPSKILFDDNCLAYPSMGTLSAASLFLVGVVNPDGTDQYIIAADGWGNNSHHFLFDGSNSVGQERLDDAVEGRVVVGGNDNSAFHMGPVVSDMPFIASMTHNSDQVSATPELTFAFNGNTDSYTLGSGGASRLGAGMIGGVTFDTTESGSIGAPLRGNISEIIYFDRKLTVNQRTAVEDYLSGKYGIALNR